MARIRHPIVTSPLARERGTELQSTNSSMLMAMVYDVMCVLMAIRAKDGMIFTPLSLFCPCSLADPKPGLQGKQTARGCHLQTCDLRSVPNSASRGLSLCPGFEASRVAGQPGIRLNPDGSVSSISRKLSQWHPFGERKVHGRPPWQLWKKSTLRRQCKITLLWYT
jgi:hypothetical protein